MKTASTLLLATLTLFAPGYTKASEPAGRPADGAEQRKPNIVLIVTDDQNPGDFGAYGGEVLTPNIDRLARKGIRFDQAYTVTTVCSPSRYTTLTGRYPGRCTHPDFFKVSPPGAISRVSNKSMTLEPQRPNLMKALQAAGYTTGIVGKWHLGTWIAGWEVDGTWKVPPGFHEMGLRHYARDASFDDPVFAEALAHNQQQFAKELEEQGWDYAASITWMNPREFHHDQLFNHNQEWITHGALKFIEANASSPFFLYMATTIAHNPHPRETLERGDDPRLTGGGKLEAHLDVQPSREGLADRVHAAGVEEEQAYLTWLDDGVGAVLDKIKKLGLEENTMVIFAADHGLPGKASLYESGTRIPLIIHHPAGAPPRAESRLVQNVDLTPTILELAGASPLPGMTFDGRSLVPLLSREDASGWRDDLYFEYGYARAIRHGKWKYIAVRYPEEDVAAFQRGEADHLPYYGHNKSLGRWQARMHKNYWDADQLYDLEADPAEKTNLAGDEDYQEVLTDMQARLKRYLATYPDRPYGDLFQPQTEEAEESIP